MRKKRIWMVALVLALVLALLPAQPTFAGTITVTITHDVLDAAGSCNAVTIASLPGPDGVTSLREAICAANNNPGPDTIEFNIPGCGGVCTIQPTSALPALFGGGTTIDGYTQPGAAPATDLTSATLLIEISGASVSDTNGFNIISAGNVIRGLVINRFSWNGVEIAGSDATGNIISGNYIGTDASGTADQGNAWDGVIIGSGAQNNTVGGDTPGERNVISGNDLDGVAIYHSNTMSNTICGNYIGTNANGTADLGNTEDGVSIAAGAQNNTVGGDTPGERNIMSGNDHSGVFIWGSGTTGNTVSGNYIGLNASGTADLGNTWSGVYIYNGAQNNTVGPGNIMAHNTLDGVTVDGSSTTGNIITQNSILANDVGIYLWDGSNGGIAAPVIVTTTLGSVNIVGTACPGCTVEVFENDDTDGEGEMYVGDTIATANSAFTVTVSFLSAPYLTATATDARGTSEFSTVFTATVTGGKIYLPIILKAY